MNFQYQNPNHSGHGNQHCAGASVPAPVPRVLHSSQIWNFPYLGVCSRCKRIAWFKNCPPDSEEMWFHECDPFRNPYLRNRRWDSFESIEALQFNLRHLLLGTNNWLHHTFGGRPHLIPSVLPEPPILYWPFASALPADLHPFIDESAAMAASPNAPPEHIGFPFLAFCPTCDKIMWHNSQGSLGHHWPADAHKDTGFSTAVYEQPSLTPFSNEMRALLDKENQRFHNIFRAIPALIKPHFGGEVGLCCMREVPYRLPCGQFSPHAEMWLLPFSSRPAVSVEWLMRATDFYLPLFEEFGAWPFSHEIIPCHPATPGQVVDMPLEPTPDNAFAMPLELMPDNALVMPLELMPDNAFAMTPFPARPHVWPIIEDPDIRGIVEFSDRMKALVLGQVGPLTSPPDGHPPPPAWEHYFAPPGVHNGARMRSITPGVSQIPMTPMYASKRGLLPWLDYSEAFTLAPDTPFYTVMCSLPPRTTLTHQQPQESTQCGNA